ncbi:phosphoglucomutase, alpha-D-glucose phosphate-specific [Dehalogenimonas formicexedens]|uniref:Phosphoglucomutase, alpha-D-glucose phosphate-specific n=1 Tax=Dehalogenimonas formicexedens TaxID=1839801 RepID=A0A1P8F528_9CHLR|nr:phosphoglucomutase/phosphomannomutase family protein [Dehalogenimonas formicexedens]APV43591.1 phosphoglucomutase, alpha-D-glucose phosphate-specific [Dehalogenimonas formicexedens]
MISNPASAIKFGTDGWRGLIARDFTFDNVAICAAAYARYLVETGMNKKGVIIGYDTRFLSEEFAREAAAVLNAAGIKVTLSVCALPTPVISWSVLNRKAGGGVVITASHNPGIWNGFKIKSDTGSSAPTEIIARVEAHLKEIIAEDYVPPRVHGDEAEKSGLLVAEDLVPAYLRHLRNLVDIPSLQTTGFKIAIDSMHGAGAGLFRQLLGENYDLAEIKAERNPVFPGMRQPEPIDINLNELEAKVVADKADVGLATDGDADRIGIVDENGIFLTQLQVMSLLALYLLDVRGERGAIVKTITTSSMLPKLGKLYDVPVFETPVGFKYVAPIMEREDAILGGEESGGYGFRNHVLERDAIIAGLYFLDFMAKTGKKPSELLKWLYSKVGEHYYHRIDVEFDAADRDAILSRLKQANPTTLEGQEVKRDTLDGWRFTLSDGSWLLFRASGTEPLLRVYAEAGSPQMVDRLLETGKKIAGV